MSQNYLTLIALLGALMPVVVSVLNSVSWSKRRKSIVAFAVCIIVALATSIGNGTFNPADIAASIGVVYAAAMVTYGSFFGPTGIAAKVEQTIIPRP